LSPRADGSQIESRSVISRIDRPMDKNIDSIRQPEWKLYRGQLFDLEADPEELWDTSLNKPKALEKLQTELDVTVQSRAPYIGEQVVPEGKTLDELKALGYLQ
jgi:hypothetical protein